jgi:hypothetical protein
MRIPEGWEGTVVALVMFAVVMSVLLTLKLVFG